MSKAKIEIKDDCNHMLVPAKSMTVGAAHHKGWYECAGCGENFFDSSQLTYKVQKLVNRRLANKDKKDKKREVSNGTWGTARQVSPTPEH